jgi:hypothetical protein
MAEIYPIDTATLAKGETIDPFALGLIHETLRNSPRLNLALLRLRDQIIAESLRIGRPLSVRICKDKLHINTDSEATEYHHGAAIAHLQGLGRQADNLRSLVDRSKLDEKTQSIHDRRVAIAALRFQAARGQRLIETKQPEAGPGEAGSGEAG